MRAKTLKAFFNDQLSCWPLACNNFRALKNVEVRDMTIGGLQVKLQFNPARIISSAAKTDDKSLNARKCFLCSHNRPQEQIFLKFDGRKGKKYDILVNPYPIFPEHFVIAINHHTGQSIWKRFVDIEDLARKYQGYTFFYNGQKCGASAPDHHHFQACTSGLMPLENAVDKAFEQLQKGQAATNMEYLTSVKDADVYHYKGFTNGVFALRADTSKSAAKLFYRLLDSAPLVDGDAEPRINLFVWFKSGQYRAIVVFRTSHRSHHYFSEGADHLTMSPGCADMGGVFIVPCKEDYDKIDERLLTEMLTEVSVTSEVETLIKQRLTRLQPLVSVGIMSGAEIEFEILSDGAGARKAKFSEGKIEYDGALYDELFFESRTLSTMFAEPSFILHNVTIGKGFHWERKEDQSFAGALKIIVEHDCLTAVNVVGVEDYLLSVISSEMKSSASIEFLKAHSVISRSWLMRRLQNHRDAKVAIKGPADITTVSSLVSYVDSIKQSSKVSQDGIVEYVKWYDDGEHRNFDVCADDHCQRYQGLTRAIGQNVRAAIDATWGKVLLYKGQLCDTRFSKCCGGVTEQYGTCWEDVQKPYLQALADTPGHSEGAKSFCDTKDEAVLSSVLNEYDLETMDFFRWSVTYSKEQISDLILANTKINIGELQAIHPLERGLSGRISKLEIRGTLVTLIVGKELEIRRILSDSHLKSSAFEVIYLSDGKTVAEGQTFDSVKLCGSGWGHGVGLCQIGAAVMASQGWCYKDILQHYYPGAQLHIID